MNMQLAKFAPNFNFMNVSANRGVSHHSHNSFFRAHASQAKGCRHINISWKKLACSRG